MDEKLFTRRSGKAKKCYEKISNLIDPHQDFKIWYDRYFSYLYFFLVGYFKKRHLQVSDSEIEDLVQNTFLSILERKSGEPIEYPWAYLKQAAISQARVFLDKKIRQGHASIPELTLQNITAVAKPSRLEKQEEEQKVWQLLASVLNQLEQTIVFKRVVQGYSYKEIAAEEDMPNEQYLHTLFHRAKNKLFHHLKDTGYDKTQP